MDLSIPISETADSALKKRGITTAFPVQKGAADQICTDFTLRAAKEWC